MNDNLVFFDGDTIHINLISEVKKGASSVLIALNVIAYLALIPLGIYLAKEVDPAAPIMTLVLAFLIYISLSRVTLWNLYGRELILISEDTFSYQFDYGWYKTDLKTIAIEEGLFLNREDSFNLEGNDMVNLHFYRSFPNDNLIYHFYTSNIRVDAKLWLKLEEILNEIHIQNWPKDLLN